MINTANQLKDLIRNLAKSKSADAQILMRNYMMERFLERVSVSQYQNKFILKGGMLIASMVGLDTRSTMDMDATIKGADVSIEAIEKMVMDIISVPIEDGVKFRIIKISEIMDEAEYPGIRVSVEAEFDRVRTPLKIDISTGDIITPREIQYCFHLMLENRSIHILAYNLETVLAEKLETIISRHTLNTRMRDFYDIYILLQLYENIINPNLLGEALEKTAINRERENLLLAAAETFNEIQNNVNMQKLWLSYQKKFHYAINISWDMAMEAVKNLYKKLPNF